LDTPNFQVSGPGCRFGFGSQAWDQYLYPNARTRYPTAETRDLRMHLLATCHPRMDAARAARGAAPTWCIIP